MLFPNKTVALENGCIAVWATCNGPRKEEGPILKGRPPAKWQGKAWKASRLSYHLNKHQILRTPPSLKTGIIMHSCDNSWCVNPEHLVLGDQKTNQADMWTRNPNVRERHRVAKLGNQNAKGKLWGEEAREKRAEEILGNQRARKTDRKSTWTPEKRERQRQLRLEKRRNADNG